MLFCFILVLGFFFFLVLGVAFLTLWERCLLGISQLRIAPNKVTWGGFVQPLFDGVKLLRKSSSLMVGGAPRWSLISPVRIFLLLWLEWGSLPLNYGWRSIRFSFLYLVLILGLGVYPLLLRGFSCRNKYTLLGSVRAGAQTVSFEILFFFFLGIFVILSNVLSISKGALLALSYWRGIFFLSLLVELARPPFDFIEGERELVRGYNVEYRRRGFVFFFLKEYGSLLFFSFFFSFVFFNFSIIFIFISFSILLFFRRVLPRFKYDSLISFFWLKLFPLLLGGFFVFFFFVLVFER